VGQPGPASDLVATATSWGAAVGVEVRRWPDLAGSHLGRSGLVLYLVEPDAEPPTCPRTQDWMRLPFDLDDFAARCGRLVESARSPAISTVRLDDDDILRVGSEIRVLPPIEARLLRRLLRRPGAVVSYDSLLRAIWPDARHVDRRNVSGPVRRLRERLVGLPIGVEAVWGRGLRVAEELPDEVHRRPGRPLPSQGVHPNTQRLGHRGETLDP